MATTTRSKRSRQRSSTSAAPAGAGTTRGRSRRTQQEVAENRQRSENAGPGERERKSSGKTTGRTRARRPELVGATSRERQARGSESYQSARGGRDESHGAHQHYAGERGGQRPDVQDWREREREEDWRRSDDRSRYAGRDEPMRWSQPGRGPAPYDERHERGGERGEAREDFRRREFPPQERGRWTDDERRRWGVRGGRDEERRGDWGRGERSWGDWRGEAERGWRGTRGAGPDWGREERGDYPRRRADYEREQGYGRGEEARYPREDYSGPAGGDYSERGWRGSVGERRDWRGESRGMTSREAWPERERGDFPRDEERAWNREPWGRAGRDYDERREAWERGTRRG